MEAMPWDAGPSATLTSVHRMPAVPHHRFDFCKSTFSHISKYCLCRWHHPLRTTGQYHRFQSCWNMFIQTFLPTWFLPNLHLMVKSTTNCSQLLSFHHALQPNMKNLSGISQQSYLSSPPPWSPPRDMVSPIASFLIYCRSSLLSPLQSIIFLHPVARESL